MNKELLIKVINNPTLQEKINFINLYMVSKNKSPSKTALLLQYLLSVNLLNEVFNFLFKKSIEETDSIVILDTKGNIISII